MATLPLGLYLARLTLLSCSQFLVLLLVLLLFPRWLRPLLSLLRFLRLSLLSPPLLHLRTTLKFFLPFRLAPQTFLSMVQLPRKHSLAFRLFPALSPHPSPLLNLPAQTHPRSPPQTIHQFLRPPQILHRHRRALKILLLRRVPEGRPQKTHQSPKRWPHLS